MWPRPGDSRDLALLSRPQSARPPSELGRAPEHPKARPNSQLRGANNEFRPFSQHRSMSSLEASLAQLSLGAAPEANFPNTSANASFHSERLGQIEDSCAPDFAHPLLLGVLALPSRTLHYRPKTAPLGRFSPGPSAPKFENPIVSPQLCPIAYAPKTAVARPRALVETQYLVAPGLAPYFYYNLVSWSAPKKAFAIGIGEAVYWWDGTGDIDRLGMVASDSISCVACHGNIVAVASCDGALSFSGVGRRLRRRFGSAIHCVRFLPLPNFLLAGTAAGEVFCLCLRERVEIISRLDGLCQQVCEIAVNADGTRAAIGGNENLVLIWDISDLSSPALLHRLEHTSAVKGLSFCPWAPSLLVSGAGSNDRHIRFWHSSSGSLLRQFFTGGQISSIHWSRSRKELVATFGFSLNGRLVGVYSYPKMNLLAEFVPGESVRALSASMAPDETQIAVVTNDGTVRMYSLWDKRKHGIVGGPGVMGSAIIEAVEGIGVGALLR
ncbi:hypothetical protein E0198_000746 [Clavispora lusitaniae]|nr:hypothetical protein E0198_000746 [Clavispora lusitaniae]